MSPATIMIIAAIVGLLVGSALVPGAPIFGLPIVALLVAILGGLEFRRRQHERRSLGEFRDEAKAEQIEFTARDRQTLAD